MRSFAELVGNTTLFSAVLVYMGWNYENSLLEYFRVPEFSVDIGTIEFALRAWCRSLTRTWSFRRVAGRGARARVKGERGARTGAEGGQ
jgi:hypothetical protein